MMTMKRMGICVCLVATMFATTGRAQQTPPVPPAPPKITTFKVDVTLTRFQGAKELGSSPYSLLVNTSSRSDGNNRGSLRIGIDVPSGTQTRTNSNSTTSTTDTVFKSVGTQIDTYVSSFDESRFAVDVSISDTSVFSDGIASDAVRQAETHRNEAARNLARQEDLFKKQLITKAQVAVFQAEANNAEAELQARQKGKGVLAHADQMAFRSFTSSNRVYLRDGESQEMTVATDRTSGETVRVSVKLTVVK